MRTALVIFVGLLAATECHAQGKVMMKDMRNGSSGYFVYDSNDVESGKPVRGKVDRVINKTSMVVRLDYGVGGKRVIVKVPTEDYVDGATFDLEAPYTITGTARAGGTYFVLETYRKPK